MGHDHRTIETTMHNNRGSILLHLVVILIIAGLIGTAMVSFMSTSVNQQVFTNTSVQADLLSESGFRYLTARYKSASDEISRNTVLKTLHGRTLVFGGQDGQVTLDIQPYFYTARSDHQAGTSRLLCEYPGTKPMGVSIPASGRLGLLSGTRYTLYTYSSRTGDDAAFTFEGITNATDASAGLDSAVPTFGTVLPVLTCTPVVLTSGPGNSLTVPDANTLMPLENGVFEIINSAGEFKDATGTRTGIYTYKTRTGTTLYDISVFKQPAAAFSLNLDTNTRIVIHRSARIVSTGAVHAGSELETRRAFTVMAGLGDTLVTVSASDLIYDNPDNVLTGLIDRAQILGDSEMVGPGKIGDAMTFDGDMDYVRLDDDPALDLTHEGSLGAWVKVTAFDNNFAGIIRKGGAADNSDLAYTLQFRPPDRIRFEIYSATSSLRLDSNASLTAGIWYHVAVTFGPAGMFIYIDGQEDNSRPDTLVVRDTDGSVQIGAQLDEVFNPSQKNYGFHGILDEVFIYTTQEDLCGIRGIFENPCNTGCDSLAYYPFDADYQDGAGEDKQGSDSNNGTASNTSFAADRFGCIDQAVQFDLWDYVEMSTESTFDFTGPFTVSAWVRVDHWAFLFSDDSFVAKGSNSFRLQRYNTSNNATFGTTGINPVETQRNDNLNDGDWHHLVGVYTGLRKELYVDGARTSANASGSLNRNNTRLRLGSLDFWSVFYGRIDDVGFWDRALDQDEIDNISKGLRTDRSLP